MKNYDDLQRFKEKTQTLDIAFKDMSGQAQEAAEHSKWALIRQLATDEHHTSLGGGQRIDLPQPQPLRGDEFSAPPPATLARQPALSEQPLAAARSSILDSLAGSNTTVESAAKTGPSSLFPPPPPKPDVVAPQPESIQSASVAGPQPAPLQPHAVAPQPAPVQFASVAQRQPVNPASGSEAGRFGALFRARDSNLPKETLLKPLLEKIALCR